jgi:hypothetical protein
VDYLQEFVASARHQDRIVVDEGREDRGGGYRRSSAIMAAARAAPSLATGR